MRRLLSDTADLVLGRHCLGCDALGPGLCPACLIELRGQAGAVGVPTLSVAATAAVRYDGVARRAVLEYKERGHRALARPLGLLLADAVLAHGPPGPGHARDPVWLVPVPGHRRSSRGFDALGAIAARAAESLVGTGHDARVARLLRSGHYAPLKQLGRAERLNQVRGAFRATRTRVPRPEGRIIVVDDVVTSGATLAEAVRVLLQAGIRIDGAATIAATGASPGRPATSRGPAPPTDRR